MSQHTIQRIARLTRSLAVWPIPLFVGALHSSHECLRFFVDNGCDSCRPISSYFDALEASIKAPARARHHGHPLDSGLNGSAALRSLQRGRSHFHQNDDNNNQASKTLPSEVSNSGTGIPAIFDVDHLCHSVRHPVGHFRTGLWSYRPTSIILSASSCG